MTNCHAWLKRVICEFADILYTWEQCDCSHRCIYYSHSSILSPVKWLTRRREQWRHPRRSTTRKMLKSSGRQWRGWVSVALVIINRDNIYRNLVFIHTCAEDRSSKQNYIYVSVTAVTVIYNDISKSLCATEGWHSFSGQRLINIWFIYLFHLNLNLVICFVQFKYTKYLQLKNNFLCEKHVARNISL